MVEKLHEICCIFTCTLSLSNCPQKNMNLCGEGASVCSQWKCLRLIPLTFLLHNVSDPYVV